MRLKRFAFGLIFCLGGLGAIVSARDYASPQLQSVLATLRGLSTSSFQQVVWWAANPAAPPMTTIDWQQAEAQVLSLADRDRNAVLMWLNSKGRGALCERGATDAMIGPKRFPIDSFNYVSCGGPAPTPSPGDWRVVPLARATLQQTAPVGGITIQNGFAAIKNDGSAALVCLSFTNVARVAATKIAFDLPLLDANSQPITSLHFERTGTFSPNVAIAGPTTVDQYQSSAQGAFAPRSLAENCLLSNQGTAALPLLQTQFVSYRVTSVQYADGSRWP
ncbi:MAG: hypothetical protein JO024_08840 [Candidatus Eremiobacteraeota bacterium]|nr:hypothetical protein [Candidatus Eremiobacteraeota bacterium]